MANDLQPKFSQFTKQAIVLVDETEYPFVVQNAEVNNQGYVLYAPKVMFSHVQIPLPLDDRDRVFMAPAILPKGTYDIYNSVYWRCDGVDGALGTVVNRWFMNGTSLGSTGSVVTGPTERQILMTGTWNNFVWGGGAVFGSMRAFGRGTNVLERTSNFFVSWDVQFRQRGV
jgi:hypothetical protein